jgi:hypothetical protein
VMPTLKPLSKLLMSVDVEDVPVAQMPFQVPIPSKSRIIVVHTPARIHGAPWPCGKYFGRSNVE